MRFNKFVVAGILMLGVAFGATAGTADNAKKIVGVWEVTKSKDAPPGATVEFTKDGKITMRAKVGDKKIEFGGTYKVEKDKINVVVSFEGKTKKDSATIKKLTDKELVIEDEKGMVDEYKRVK